jgi:short-subunit dehydrogenase involved in D-alanine esterification of teichoic acids
LRRFGARGRTRVRGSIPDRDGRLDVLLNNAWNMARADLLDGSVSAERIAQEIAVNGPARTYSRARCCRL